MDLTEVLDRVRADDDGKADVVAERELLSLHDGRLYCPTAPVTGGLALTGWATTQLCGRLGMPASYYKRCPPPLQDAQANHWLSQSDKPERWLLRTKENTLRGLLTERYSALDNGEVLATLAPLVDPHYRVGWFELSDESFHLRLVDPKLAREVLPHDRLVAGVHIANSEVGKRAVTVDALVWRLVCSNGLVRLVRGKSLLHQRHIAQSKPRFELALATAVREALIHGVGFIERLSWATKVPVPDVDDTLDALGRQWGLSAATVEAARTGLSDMPPDQHETLYGLVNGLTHAAQRLAPDDRYTLETLAGELVERGLSPDGLRLDGGHRRRMPVEGAEEGLFG